MHKPESVLEMDTHKILWDFEIQVDHQIQTKRQDLELINKKKKLYVVNIVASAKQSENKRAR